MFWTFPNMKHSVNTYMNISFLSYTSRINKRLLWKNFKVNKPQAFFHKSSSRVQKQPDTERVFIVATFDFHILFCQEIKQISIFVQKPRRTSFWFSCTISSAKVHVAEVAIPVTKVSRIRRKIKHLVHLVHWQTVRCTVSLVLCSGTFTRILTFVYIVIFVLVCVCGFCSVYELHFVLKDPATHYLDARDSGFFGGFLNKVSF